MKFLLPKKLQAHVASFLINKKESLLLIQLKYNPEFRLTCPDVHDSCHFPILEPITLACE